MKTFFNNIFKSNLEKAIIRFHEIADSTGILESGITREPNPNERDELWTITRTFLKRIYSLDINEQMSDDDNREYNQLCHWSIVALHWNDLQLSDEAFSPDNGRFRRDTIALAICLYTRLSSRYKYFNKIKSEFIMPHAYGSILLWTLNNITNCNTDNFFGKYEPGTTKEALKDYHILFNKYGRYHVEDDDCDNKDLKTIWFEIYHRFSSDRKPYQFVLDYIWMGPGLPGGMGLLSEDRDMNKAFLQKMLAHNQFPDDWCSINDLAYVYIYFATTTDDDLAKSEEIQILSVLSSWSSGEKDEDKSARALSCYNNAMELFSIDQSYERFLCVLTNIYNYIDKIQKGDKVKINTMLNFILKDLSQVALADEVINANEFHLIEWIRKSWKIDAKLFNDDIYEIYENDKIDSKEEVIEEESARKEEKVRKDTSEFLTDYPGDLYCKNQRWDSVLGLEYKSSFQPFPNVFEDGEYKYEDLFRRFTHEEVNVIVEKIKCTGTLIYLPFVHRILSKKFDTRGLKIPFWFDPFIISGALNGAGGIFYFEQNGFYSNTYDAPGNWLEPTNISSIMHVDMIVHLDQEAGYNGYWNEYISGDEEIVTTLDIEYENPASGNGGEISLIQTNGTEYASTLPIVEAIWDHSWSSVVEASKETSIFVLPTNCEYFDSWDDLLTWARSKENSQNSKGISEEGIIVKEDNSDSFSSDELQVKSLVHIKSMLPFAELFKAEKNIEALDSIFEKSHNLWVENLNKIKGKVKYIMFCEAPPFDADGSISNYIYDRTGEAKGMYLKAPYKALKGVVDSYPSKSEMIDFLNKQGFLFLDVVPLSINYSPKRNTKKYKDFVKYFWNGTGIDLGFSEYTVQNRITEMKGKISKDLRVCFSLKSISMVVNSISNPNLKLGDKTIHISENLVGLNTAGQPSVTEIKKAFETKVIK